MSSVHRLRIHAGKMSDEGWHVTSNVMEWAGDEIEAGYALARAVVAHFDGTDSPLAAQARALLPEEAA